MFTLSGFNKLRIGVTTLPAVLKTRSDGVLVAHMHRYFRANPAMNGNLFSFVFHQVRGSSSPSMAISCRYMVISDSTFCSSVSMAAAAVAALFARLPKDHFFFLGTVGRRHLVPLHLLQHMRDLVLALAATEQSLSQSLPSFQIL